MRLAAGLRPDLLGELERSPDLPDLWGGEGKKGMPPLYLTSGYGPDLGGENPRQDF